MVYCLVNVLYSTCALNFPIFIYYVASVLGASVTQIYIRSIGGYRSVPATLGSGIRGVTWGTPTPTLTETENTLRTNCVTIIFHIYYIQKNYQTSQTM